MAFVLSRLIFVVLIAGVPAGVAAWLGVTHLRRWSPLASALLSPVLGLFSWFFILACLGQPDVIQALSAVSQLSVELLGTMLGAALGSVTGCFTSLVDTPAARGRLAGIGSLSASTVAALIFLNQAVEQALYYNGV